MGRSICRNPEGFLLENAEALYGLVNIREVDTAVYAAVADDGLIIVDATAAPTTVTLPAVADVQRGKRIIVKKSDVSVNAVTVDGNGAETVDGAANASLAGQYDFVEVVSDGAKWWVIAVG